MLRRIWAPLSISLGTPLVRQQNTCLPAAALLSSKSSVILFSLPVVTSTSTLPCAYAHIFSYLSDSSNGVQGDIHTAHKAFEYCLSIVHKIFDVKIGGPCRCDCTRSGIPRHYPLPRRRSEDSACEQLSVAVFMQTPWFNILAMAPALPFSNRTVSTKKEWPKGARCSRQE